MTYPVLSTSKTNLPEMPPRFRAPTGKVFDQTFCPHHRPRSQCAKPQRLLAAPPYQRSFTTTSIAKAEPEGQWVDGTRWNETPRAMRAPISLKKHDPNNHFTVNESQEVLDGVYNTILGDNGDKLLTEEVKWLAVTHKSFDQGRRGYNDRLAFLGKRIIDLQTSLALLNRKDGTFVDPPDEFEREPFRHPGVDLLPRLSDQTKGEFVSSPRIASMAHSLGLGQVVRWKPRKAQDLRESGSEKVLAQALYAIVGAVALQRGGEMAVRVVRERLFSRLGLDV